MDFTSFFEKIKEDDAQKEARVKQRYEEQLQAEYTMVCERIETARKEGFRSVSIPLISQETFNSLRKCAKRIEQDKRTNPSTHEDHVVGYKVYF